MTDEDGGDPLTWLSTILWPDRTATIGDGGDDGRPMWWAAPSVEEPNILIPADSMAAARTAVRRYHDGFSPALRFRSVTAEALMTAEPVARRVLRGREVGLRAASADADAGPGQSVLDGLRELLDVDRLHVAVSLSTPKSNRKPVLQLLDDDGRCLGWAKVAWNDRTEALVANESRWLNGRAVAPLSMPRLLHDVRIAGRRVVIGSGVDPSRRPHRAPSAPPPPELFRAVLDLGTRRTVAIEESDWWRSVEWVLGTADVREREAIIGATESCRGLRFQVGAWHGDLTPWNLMTTGSRIHLIDWEFAADGVPFGFDLCHFHTQVASEMKAGDAPHSDRPVGADALDHSARLSPQGLADLGIEPENRLPLWRLYLVELLRRYLSLRANGYPVDRVTQGPAALARLERALLLRPEVTPGNRPDGDRPEQREGTESSPDAPIRSRREIGEAIAADIGVEFNVGDEPGVTAR